MKCLIQAEAAASHLICTIVFANGLGKALCRYIPRYLVENLLTSSLRL